MNTSKLSSIILPFLLIILFSCRKKEKTLFDQLHSEQTGIDFTNQIFESDTLNILTEEYIYNGGGVGVGDFNNDGFQDLYFTGNMVSNKLYLNQGNFAFKDVTETSDVDGEGRWCTGVAVVDINQDGLLDIYVGASLKKDSLSKSNLLYINQGINNDKVPLFKELAAEYGLSDSGGTTHSAFFDYDKDGDLDLYVLTNVQSEKIPVVFRDKIVDGSSLNNDRLYRNNGNGTFSNVTKEAGILIEGYGLGLTISDINLDGWQDIYVTNDYMSNDLLYINNRDGTFSNKINDYFKHTCFSAMGNDVVDINNDGLVDVIALDMLPEDNKRKKLMVKDNNYISYINFKHFDYQHQYVRNVLQLNQGFTSKGHPVFSEIAQLAGTFQTDWSWTPLVADFDNDGLRDIIITNGFPRDVTDRDFISYRSGPAGALVSNMNLVDSIPQVKIPNYAYKNMGNVSFSDVTKDWGLSMPSFSNGAIYSDLDNDGDLDIVINNINDKASVYKNTTIDVKKQSQSNFLRVVLKGTAPNLEGFGAKVYCYYDNGKKLFYEHSPYRGYLSSVESLAHFGVGNTKNIDSVLVYWPDSSFQILKSVPTNKVVTFHRKDANIKKELLSPIPLQPSVFKEVASSIGVNFKHKEDDKIDFNLQRTLPHKFSQSGPGVAVGDIDNNGAEDFYLGGSAGKKGVFFMQSSNGSFKIDSTRIKNTYDKMWEDMGVLLFDADNDNDLDLYTATGSYEFPEGADQLVDKFYVNNGTGFFSLDSAAIPNLRISGSCVKAADYDKDGDLDLFVGGRIISGKYPLPVKSCILQNNKGRFTDVTPAVCHELEKLGIVNDALWSDFDNDSYLDLIIVGEWMPITFLKNVKGKFVNSTASSGISAKVGWWNSLSSGDYDNDGDIDYVAGNLGLNTHYKATSEQPLMVYAKDFDNSGRFKAVLSCYIKDHDGKMKPFPMHTRDDLFVQMPVVKKKFATYGKYSSATIDKIFTKEEMKDAVVLKATYFASSYLENVGGGKFQISELPLEAQLAPVFGIISSDYDLDGNVDLLLVGNDYGNEVFTGRYDALLGLYLKGDGKGKFKPISLTESGFLVDGDAKGLTEIYSKSGKLILSTQNQDSLKVFSSKQVKTKPLKVIKINPDDQYCNVAYKNGKRSKKEFYYGSTYLSQSSRQMEIASEVESVTIVDFFGQSRVVKF